MYKDIFTLKYFFGMSSTAIIKAACAVTTVVKEEGKCDEFLKIIRNAVTSLILRPESKRK